jgi:hypothetical protein
MIKLLPEDRWPELADIFRDAFEGSELPTAGQAIIPAEIDDETGEIRAFVVLEQVFRVGQVWSNGGKPWDLFKYLEANVQSGTVIGITDEVRHETVFRRFKMREVEGRLFRRDF